MGGKQIVSPGAIEQLNNNLTNKTEWVYVGQTTVTNNSESTPSSDAVQFSADTKELFLRIALNDTLIYSFPMYVPLDAIWTSQSLYATFYNNNTYNSAIIQIDKTLRKVWVRMLTVSGTTKTNCLVAVYHRK